MDKEYVASDLIAKINHALEGDQGESWKRHIRELTPHFLNEKQNDGLRSHLGASAIGNECARAIWLQFRWADKESFEGRILRIFERGKQEEIRLIALLKMIGANVKFQNNQGKQFQVEDCGGHFGGSCDAVARNIITDNPELTALLEFKTHNNTSFVSLTGKLVDYRKFLKDPKNSHFSGKGLKLAKPEHYTQMQIYMHKMNILAGVYFAVNKDTDDLYIEYVKLDRPHAQAAIDHASNIIFAHQSPPKICRDSSFFKAKLCSSCNVCFGFTETLKNCRTCAKVIPSENGEWICGGRSGRVVLTKEDQIAACEHYRKVEL